MDGLVTVWPGRQKAGFYPLEEAAFQERQGPGLPRTQGHRPPSQRRPADDGDLQQSESCPHPALELQGYWPLHQRQKPRHHPFPNPPQAQHAYPPKIYSRHFPK